MVVARGNGGKYTIGTAIDGEELIFTEVIVTGMNFNADLVADPSNPADVAAAIGSDLEQLAEMVAEYGTILGMAVDGTYAEFITSHGSQFADPAISQLLFDRLVDEKGWTPTTVYTSYMAYPYNWQAPA